MKIPLKVAKSLKMAIEFNSHDLGEFGKVIKLEYLMNILMAYGFSPDSIKSKVKKQFNQE